MGNTDNIRLKAYYRVEKVNKVSKARYAKGIKKDDVLTFVMNVIRTVGASNGNYALMTELYVNRVLQCEISQNEMPKMVEIFDLQEL